MTAAKPLRVLFVCIGNSCRSQMAEGFAKAYGKDVLSVQSAGLAPASYIASLTKEVMAEKDISLESHFPKTFDLFNPRNFDLIINLSGRPLPKGLIVNQQVWPVGDPIGQDISVFRATRDDIERRVQRLILEERQKQSPPASSG